jgi:hypothetical protein
VAGTAAPGARCPEPTREARTAPASSVDVFPAILGRVADLRNPCVHRAHVLREEVLRLRASLVGVGCQGAVVELAKVRPRR